MDIVSFKSFTWNGNLAGLSLALVAHDSSFSCVWLFCLKKNNARAVGLSSHQHEHYVDVAWRNARYAACLRHRFRVDCLKLLSGFR